jgi:hypothetical protein
MFLPFGYWWPAAQDGGGGDLCGFRVVVLGSASFTAC